MMKIIGPMCIAFDATIAVYDLTHDSPGLGSIMVGATVMVYLLWYGKLT